MGDAFHLPDPLPPGFSLRTAIRCARLVDDVYGFYQQWSDAGKPPPAQMVFRPIRAGRSSLVFSEPFWRTLTYRKPIHPGSRHALRRTAEVVECTPAGACARQGQRLFIVFRGTLGQAEKITNWMATRRDAVFDDLEGGGVHRGFHRCYESVREAIMKFVRDEADADKTIRIVGYSLGGALASLAAMDVATYGLPYRALEVFTFASPRVGSRKWAAHFDRQRIRSWRIANERDLVAKVPPALFGYRHVGTPLLFSSREGDAPHGLMNTYLPALRRAGSGRPPAI